jgi:transcription antitermination protein NusB
MSKHRARHKARQYAVQAIYQWQFTQASLTEIELQFHEDNDMAKIDSDYFSELLHGVPKHITEINDLIKEAIDRPFHDLNPVELAVLRVAIYELIYRKDVPYKVVINEALQVTKIFGASEGFKYVNGVLDALVKKLRPLEITLQKTNKLEVGEQKEE